MARSDDDTYYRAIVEAQTELVSLARANGQLVYVNPAYARHFGRAPAAMIGANLLDFIDPADRAAVRARIARVFDTADTLVGENRMLRADGSECWLAWINRLQRDAGGDSLLHSVGRDITERKLAEQALLESEARLRTVADALPMRVAYIDADERYRFNNLAYERGFGLSREQIQGRTVRELLGDAAYRSVEPHVRAALRGETVTFQSEMTNAAGYFCFEANYIPQRSNDGDTVVGFHAVITNITRQKLEERRLVNLTRLDPLTGVLNRTGFDQLLVESMSRCRATGAPMALMYMDIDHFKKINDQLGHQAGDSLLRAFAGRLGQTLRSTDVVARLGGDEFTVIIEDLSSAEIATALAAKIILAVDTPFDVDEYALAVTTSIGVALYDGGDMTSDALIKQADEALYQAKRAGRNNYQVAARPPIHSHRPINQEAPEP